MEQRMREALSRKARQIQGYLIRLGAERTLAEDIVQETVYKGLVHMDAIHPDKFSAWLYKVALNHYYDICRRQKRIMVPYEDSPADDAGGDPELSMLRKEKREEIDRVLDRLNPVYKQLLIMKYELDLSYQEIAGLLGIRSEKVKTYLFRARKQFQKMYGGMDDDGGKEERSRNGA
ncbi:RNA polymerase sigma-70 factor, ECF subfamily [Paenibacillus sp. RU4T]|nr:RNA polymerase sigma-70 factor, ECF subfamily [Paenibacillus sp. RU4X]SIR57664.1 RNA polymerase sigma-70 factor, ECF subfamily [Paenibacillus sp. RU4T]